MSAGPKAELSGFLAKGTNFKGELRFSGIVRIDGIFEGRIISDGTLVVGETGILKGEVHVGALLSSGVVEGTIRASKSIAIDGEGKLLGKASSPSLSVAEGALVEAQLKIGAGDVKSQPTGGTAAEPSSPEVSRK